MSRITEQTDALQALHIRPKGEKVVTLKPPEGHTVATPPTPPMSHPTTTAPALSDKAATVFPSHVRASSRRDPADRTGELVRLLDDISTVTHSISSYVAERAQTSLITDPDQVPDRTPLDPNVATHKLYTSLSHDGYACIILERRQEAPLTFSATALQGGYVVMLSALDIDPTADDHLLCGTIFSVYRRKSPNSLPGRLKDLQQCVSDQVAAGYVLYSSATTLYYTMGAGAFSFCLHPVATQYFLQPSSALKLPESGADLYADYEECKVDHGIGAAALELCSNNGGTVYDNGSLCANFNGASVSGCLVVRHDVHLLCEAAPLAFLMEQLGGKATDGSGTRILDMAVLDEDVHKKVSFCAGAAKLVDEAEARAKELAGPQL